MSARQVPREIPQIGQAVNPRKRGQDVIPDRRKKKKRGPDGHQFKSRSRSRERTEKKIHFVIVPKPIKTTGAATEKRGHRPAPIREAEKKEKVINILEIDEGIETKNTTGRREGR